jgi:hypothetical protein
MHPHVVIHVTLAQVALVARGIAFGVALLVAYLAVRRTK